MPPGHLPWPDSECQIDTNSTSSDDPQQVAIEQLRQFGLSTYAARTFVALVMLNGGTARDVSRVSEVPRTRVYDAAEELDTAGLVDVRESSPRRFWAVSIETAGSMFQRELHRRTRVLTDALEDVDPRDRHATRIEAWTVEGREAVTRRLLEFLAAAEDRISFAARDDLLTDAVLDELAAAHDRGATVRLVEDGGDVRERVAAAVPGLESIESAGAPGPAPAGRFAMVDAEAAIASVLEPPEDPADGRPSETAVWGFGETNGLVVTLRRTFLGDRDGGPTNA